VWFYNFAVPISDYGVVLFVGQTSPTAGPVLRLFKP